jgi:hypothetical protein
MADRYPHWCSIGGTVTAKKREAIMTQVRKAGWPDFSINPAEGKFVLTDCDAVCDAYEEFLRWLQKNKLAYDYICGARGEYSGDLTKWRPGMRAQVSTDVDAKDRTILSESGVKKLLAMLDTKGCSAKKAAAFVRDELLMNIPALPKFVVED